MTLTVARRADATNWAERAGRVGLAARGIVYCIVAALAVALATGDRSEQVDQRGALAELAERPGGKLALGALVVGFVAYALWRLARAVWGEGTDDPGIGSRILDLARVVIYGALAVSAYRLLRGDEGAASSQHEAQQGFTARLMADHSWGRWAVGLVGAGIVAGALWQIYKGLSQKFREHLQESFGPSRAAVVTLGVVGHVARGLVFLVAGWLVIRTAVRFDPAQPLGIDAALREVAHAPYGPALLVAVALGLGAFGLYSLAEAKYREVI
jgi:hypothetical protein